MIQCTVVINIFIFQVININHSYKNKFIHIKITNDIIVNITENYLSAKYMFLYAKSCVKILIYNLYKTKIILHITILS